MRQIILDTETTGLDPAAGHRIIEIAGVEIVNRRLTGNHFPDTLIRNAQTAVFPTMPPKLRDQLVKGAMTADAVEDASRALKKRRIERALGAR
jgi:DNA polymerase III epsilon subunit-like protein